MLITRPRRRCAEYVAHPTAAATGRQVHHLLMGRIVARLRGVVHASLTIVSPGVSPKQAGTEAPPAKGAATGLLACVDERESRPAVLLGVHSRSRREGRFGRRLPCRSHVACRLTSLGAWTSPCRPRPPGPLLRYELSATRDVSQTAAGPFASQRPSSAHAQARAAANAAWAPLGSFVANQARACCSDVSTSGAGSSGRPRPAADRRGPSRPLGDRHVDH